MTATACRACLSPRLTPVLDLGQQPLANALDSTATYPLAVVLCDACTLLQLDYAPPPEVLFASDYPYYSSTSAAMVAHTGALVSRLMARAPRHVVELASNDGYLLQHYVARGVEVTGFEPAAGPAAAAVARGVRTRWEFFGRDTEGPPADIIHANNVMAHVPDIRGVLAGCARMLADDGMLIIETPYVGALVEQTAFDTIYHEHLFYWSLTALMKAARSAGLSVHDVEPISIHGGSIRVTLGRGGEESDAVLDMLAFEVCGFDYSGFEERVVTTRQKLRAMLHSMKSGGASIAAYGAAAKGSTLLNYCGIGPDVLDFVADRSPHKIGRRMPGVGIPIVAADELVAGQPDYCLLLTWNFADEIREQMAAYRGKWIVAVPDVRMLT